MFVKECDEIFNEYYVSLERETMINTVTFEFEWASRPAFYGKKKKYANNCWQWTLRDFGNMTVAEDTKLKTVVISCQKVFPWVFRYRMQEANKIFASHVNEQDML